jgi:hypothetical protein
VREGLKYKNRKCGERYFEGCERYVCTIGFIYYEMFKVKNLKKLERF